MLAKRLEVERDMKMNLRTQALIQVAGSVTYLFCQWLLTVFTTRVLGYQEAGILTLSISVGNIFTFFQLYGGRSFQTSDVTMKYSPGDYLITRLVTVAGGVSLCALTLFSLEYPLSTSLSIFLFTLFRGFEALALYGDMQRSGRLELAGFSMILRGALIAPLFAIGLSQFHTLNAALGLIVSASAAVTILDGVFYRRIVAWKGGTLKHMIEILRLCFPLLWASLLPSLITAIPRMIMERHFGR